MLILIYFQTLVKLFPHIKDGLDNAFVAEKFLFSPFILKYC